MRKRNEIEEGHTRVSEDSTVTYDHIYMGNLFVINMPRFLLEMWQQIQMMKILF